MWYLFLLDRRRSFMITLAILSLIVPTRSAEHACFLVKVSNLFLYRLNNVFAGCFFFKCCNTELMPLQMLYAMGFLPFFVKKFHTCDLYFFPSTSLMLWLLASSASSSLVTPVKLSAILNVITCEYLLCNQLFKYHATEYYSNYLTIRLSLSIHTSTTNCVLKLKHYAHNILQKSFTD